jgi:phosphohistidine phosphatase SixA
MSGDVVELWLLRHAHAGDPAKWQGDDAARPLSAKGRAQAEQLARFMVDHALRPDVIVSSPKLRATQTAEAVARVFALDIRNDDRLIGPLDLAAVDAILGGAGGQARRTMLVGHDPDFSRLVSELTGARDVRMRKGALARIDTTRPPTSGAGVLVWLIPPQALDPAG